MYITLLALFMSVSSTTPSAFAYGSFPQTQPAVAEVISAVRTDVPLVPFYSQFRDISSAQWQKVGCGIASMAMLIEFYNPGSVSVDRLLREGISAGAFLENAGWKHKDLARLSNKYGLEGKTYDLSSEQMSTAFAHLKTSLKEGPVIVSVHYKFDPKSTIPHLAVINGITGDTLSYNDPAESVGGKTISISDFMKAWKKRYITVRPITDYTG